MDTLHWPLSVLSRAVHFKNLTSASSHVGLSQPQLSRLIHQIEGELNVVLLDRSVKRKSAWTPTALKLAELYSQSSRKLEGSIKEIAESQVPSHITIGTLEGLGAISMRIAHDLLLEPKVESVELDVYDRSGLDKRFLNNDLDLVVTSRNPTKQKLAHQIEFGFQSLERVAKNDKFGVLSGFEYGRLKKKPSNKTLISNSLLIREKWLNEYGGEGVLPSPVRRTKGANAGAEPVLILAGDLFHNQLWKVVQASLLKLERDLR